jgi:hypothetical protein
MESIRAASSRDRRLPALIATALWAWYGTGCHAEIRLSAGAAVGTSASESDVDADDGRARVTPFRDGGAGPGALDRVTAVFQSADRACAVELRRRVWCWDLGDGVAELESCSVGEVQRVAPGSGSLAECLACETTVAGDAYCWALGSTHRLLRLPLPSGARAADVQTSTAYEMAGRLGRCSATVQLTNGGLMGYEIDRAEGLAPDGGALAEVLLPVPAPVERVVMERSSICAQLTDHRVWCSFYLDAMPTRVRTVGHAPPPGVIPELRGATDVRIVDLCAIGTLDEGRRREVCVGQISGEGGGATVVYRRTVRDRAELSTNGGGPACVISSKGGATCTSERGTATIVRRGEVAVAGGCEDGIEGTGTTSP